MGKVFLDVETLIDGETVHSHVVINAEPYATLLDRLGRAKNKWSRTERPFRSVCAVYMPQDAIRALRKTESIMSVRNGRTFLVGWPDIRLGGLDELPIMRIASAFMAR